MTDNTQSHTHIFRRGVDNTGEYNVCECGFRLEPHNTQAELDDRQHIKFNILVPFLTAITIKRQKEKGDLIKDTETAYYDFAVDLILDWHNKQIDQATDSVEAMVADIEFKAGINHVTMGGEWIHKDEVNRQIEEIIKKPHILPKNAQHLESVKQGINFYHRQMRKRVDRLKEAK